MRIKIGRSKFYVLFAVAVATTLMLFAALQIWPGNWRMVNISLHTFMEVLMAVTSISVSLLLFGKSPEFDREIYFPALGFLGMGLLDCIHAILTPGHGFVLFRSAANLFGGFCFMLVCVPFPSTAGYPALRKLLPWCIAAVSVLLGILATSFREIFPLMVHNEKFTFAARFVNTLSGVFFLVSTIYFLLVFHRSGKTINFLYAIITALFGLSGLTFSYSFFWDRTWWFWHLLRLTGYSIVLWFMYRESREMTSNIRAALSAHETAQDELERSHTQLRNLSAHLQSAREEDRVFLAREIHDELGQALTALKMDVSWIGERLPADNRLLLEKAASSLKLIDETINKVRRICTELRPEMLDHLGLEAAIEWQSREFENRTGIKCNVLLDPAEVNLSGELSTAIFRILQETLTNAARHANASSVDISLIKEDGILTLSVTDNGIGITEEAVSVPESFGLVGIKERVKYFGGDVVISGKKGEGTTIKVNFPLDK